MVAVKKMRMRKAAAAADAASTVAYLQATVDAANAASYTFASQNLGTADADRTIVVFVGSRASGATAFNVSSVTVAGVTATSVVQQSVTSASASLCALYAVDLPTGTSGDVVVTPNRSAVRCGIAVFRCTGISTTANDTATDSQVSASTALALSVDTTADGIVIGGAFNGANVENAWANVTERFDGVAESSRFTVASDEYATAQTVAATVTPTSSWTEGVGVAAAW